jgi:peptidoglycan-N-acetylglucosamine deacetylase
VDASSTRNGISAAAHEGVKDSFGSTNREDALLVGFTQIHHFKINDAHVTLPPQIHNQPAIHIMSSLLHRRQFLQNVTLSMSAGLLGVLPSSLRALEPVPDKLVVLTFDDSVASHATFVAPLLKRHGFGATFFITEGFEFSTDKEHYLTWEQIKVMNADGFEIGNHTRQHSNVAGQTPEQLLADVEYIEQQCAKYEIPRPTSFCYPGYKSSIAAIKLLSERGYHFARAGGAQAFDPTKDEHLALPQAFDGKPESTLDQFKTAVSQARDGKVAVLTFHGVPDIKHPWVNTDAAKFESYMEHLKQTQCKVIALRELSKYTAPKQR